jgi:hypothetical protein
MRLKPRSLPHNTLTSSAGGIQNKSSSDVLNKSRLIAQIHPGCRLYYSHRPFTHTWRRCTYTVQVYVFMFTNLQVQEQHYRSEFYAFAFWAPLVAEQLAVI